jgi:hypothetical protein
MIVKDRKWLKDIIKSFRLSPAHLALVEEECRLRKVGFSEYVRDATMVAMTHVKDRAAIAASVRL